MKKAMLIFNTMMLMALPVFGSAETLEPSEVPTISSKVVSPAHKEAVCFGIYLLSFNILQEKYHGGSLEQSKYYNVDKDNELKAYFGEAMPDLKKLTQTIYSLPVIEDLAQRKIQYDMVENLVTASCGLSLHIL